jgi:hypothetical protein
MTNDCRVIVPGASASKDAAPPVRPQRRLLVAAPGPAPFAPNGHAGGTNGRFVIIGGAG